MRLFLIQSLVAFGLLGFLYTWLSPPEKPSSVRLGSGHRGPRILPCGWDSKVTGSQVPTGWTSLQGGAERSCPRAPWLCVRDNTSVTSLQLSHNGSPHRPPGAPFVPLYASARGIFLECSPGQVLPLHKAICWLPTEVQAPSGT